MDRRNLGWGGLAGFGLLRPGRGCCVRAPRQRVPAPARSGPGSVSGRVWRAGERSGRVWLSARGDIIDAWDSGACVACHGELSVVDSVLRLYAPFWRVLHMRSMISTRTRGECVIQSSRCLKIDMAKNKAARHKCGRRARVLIWGPAWRFEAESRWCADISSHWSTAAVSGRSGAFPRGVYSGRADLGSGASEGTKKPGARPGGSGVIWRFSAAQTVPGAAARGYKRRSAKFQPPSVGNRAGGCFAPWLARVVTGRPGPFCYGSHNGKRNENQNAHLNTSDRSTRSHAMRSKSAIYQARTSYFSPM